MYDQTAQRSGHRKDFRFSGGTSGRRTPKTGSGRQERLRLLQLLVCLVLFLTVFIGKGVFPSKLIQIRDDVLTMIGSDTDFQAAFFQLGESLAGEGTVFDKLGDFCVEVFGTQPLEPEGSAPVPALTSLMQTERRFLSENPDSRSLSQHFFEAGGRSSALVLPQWKERQPEQTAPEVPEQAPAAVAVAGAILLKSNYSGEPLPANYTMDQLSLGNLETVTPVLGHIRSDYGYRDHPINGKYQFHGGLDIGGQNGDPIKAFAAGTVEYVGQDDSYGLYMQLDHGNGVKSFYAHCSRVTVTKGQKVGLGEKIGEVGSSGAATGPHLHLELKYNKTHLNPIYYVEYLANQ